MVSRAHKKGWGSLEPEGRSQSQGHPKPLALEFGFYPSRGIEFPEPEIGGQIIADEQWNGRNWGRSCQDNRP